MAGVFVPTRHYDMPARRDVSRQSPVVGQFDCHPEQAFFAQLGISASRFAPPRERDASLFKLTHYRFSRPLALTQQTIYTPQDTKLSRRPWPILG